MVSSESPPNDTRPFLPSGPVRTCVGCRARAAKSELLRVVAGSVEQGRRTLKPDPAGVASGRGAYVHRDPDCLQTAQRRRAFGRALRVREALDDAELADYVAAGT